jgi:methionine--tRNA ligase beta chain
VKPTIPFSDFSRLDLRVGTVTKAEQIEGTANLLRLDVELGDVGRKQLVAGLAQTHKPSDLIGKQIAVVVNLEAREIRGVNSQGMLLAADFNETPVLLFPEKNVPSGAKIR